MSSADLPGERLQAAETAIQLLPSHPRGQGQPSRAGRSASRGRDSRCGGRRRLPGGRCHRLAGPGAATELADVNAERDMSHRPDSSLLSIVADLQRHEASHAIGKCSLLPMIDGDAGGKASWSSRAKTSISPVITWSSVDHVHDDLRADQRRAQEPQDAPPREIPRIPDFVVASPPACLSPHPFRHLNRHGIRLPT